MIRETVQVKFQPEGEKGEIGLSSHLYHDGITTHSKQDFQHTRVSRNDGFSFGLNCMKWKRKSSTKL
jgi:hypothetical protein